MIEIKQLQVNFGEKKILNGLNIKFDIGKINVIIGLNGAGKTTFFNTLFGFIKPNNGHLLYNAQKLLKIKIAFLETESFFYSYLTGTEFLNIYKASQLPQIFNISELCILFNLDMDMLVENFSTGMKKKLAIIGILKLNREIFIFDEPFNGLDIESAIIFKEILQKLKNNKRTIFLSSHIIDAFNLIGDDFYLVENKVISKFDSKKDFQDYCVDIDKNISKKIETIMLK